MNSFLLKDAFVLTNNSARDFLRADILVINGRIAEISENISIKNHPKAPANIQIFSLPNQVIIPGFVQTHVHLCQTLFRNLADDLALLDWLSRRIWPMEGAHTEKSLYASASLGIAELLSSGTTTILDMGTVRHTDQIFQAAKEFGIRAFIGKCLMDRDDNPKELREDSRHALQENEALAKRWHNTENGRLHYAHAPRFVLSCTENLLKEVSAFATSEGHLIHTHASENRDEIARVRELHNCENIEYFHQLGLTNKRLVLAHCVHVSPHEMDMLRDTQTNVSHCPSSNLKLASGIAPVVEMRAHGVNVSLGADGAPCNNNLNMFQEMRTASLLQKPLHGPEALPAQEVFEMATIAGAKALGIDKEIGSIEVGKKADLVALNLHQLHSHVELRPGPNPHHVYSAIVYAGQPINVTHTWVDGKLVYENGTIPGKDVAKILDSALAQQKSIMLDT